jgi:CBS domain-containing protein
MIKVGDFMTRELVTVRETDDLALADSILRLGGIRHLPVVREGKLSGLLTQRDLLRAGATGSAARAVLARDVMVSRLTTVTPDSSLAEAAQIMLRHKFGCLPVCDGDGTLVGMVTESDFVRFAASVVQDLDVVPDTVTTRADA